MKPHVLLALADELEQADAAGGIALSLQFVVAALRRVAAREQEQDTAESREVLEIVTWCAAELGVQVRELLGRRVDSKSILPLQLVVACVARHGTTAGWPMIARVLGKKSHNELIRRFRQLQGGPPSPTHLLVERLLQSWQARSKDGAESPQQEATDQERQDDAAQRPPPPGPAGSLLSDCCLVQGTKFIPG